MKYLKFISICLLASFAMSVSAEVTSQATIKVTGDLGGVYEQVFLTEDDAAPADFSSRDNAPFNKGTSNLAVELFTLDGTDKYSTVVINSLDDLKLNFVANAYEEAYTMSFSGVTGKINLANADTSFVIDAKNDYKFTCAKSAVVEFTVSKGAPTSVAEYKAAPAKEGKMILNGQLVIKKDGKMFNAQGAAL